MIQQTADNQARAPEASKAPTTRTGDSMSPFAALPPHCAMAAPADLSEAAVRAAVDDTVAQVAAP